MDLTGYTFEQLIELKNTIEGMIYSYTDGYEYICKVRSYGRNWVERPKNSYEVQNLSYRYFGDDGIVDVYTTNPNLKIEIYGNVFYIESVEDYNKWKNYHDTEIILKDIEESLIEYEKIQKMMTENSTSQIKDLISNSVKNELKNIITEANDFEEDELDSEKDNKGTDDINPDADDELKSDSEPEGGEDVDSENKPFNQRPYFKPYWSRDELNEKRVEFENLDKDFIEPKLI